MPRWLMFAIFIFVALLIVGGIHFYIYRRLIVASALPAPWGRVAMAALIVMALSIPASFLISRVLGGVAAKIVLYPIYVWLGMMFMTLVTLLGLDAVRGIVWLVSRLAGSDVAGFDPERRLFLSRMLAGAVVGTVVTATGFALRRGLGRLAVKRIEVKLDNLPAKLDGFTIAQLTDLHLTPIHGGDWLASVVRMTNELKPDLVAITGDLADGTVAQLGKDVESLKELKAPHGVFFVTGNHEYFFDLDNWLELLDRFGMRVLRNERVPIALGDAVFDLAGVDDQEGIRLAPGHGTDVAKAMQNRDADRAVVLLAHQPRAIKEAARHRVGLVLSGHTHGGQIWPFRYAVYLQQPYVSGLHNHNGTHIYVSGGTGYWGPPMRLGTTPEITLVTLRSPLSQRGFDEQGTELG